MSTESSDTLAINVIENISANILIIENSLRKIDKAIQLSRASIRVLESCTDLPPETLKVKLRDELNKVTKDLNEEADESSAEITPEEIKDNILDEDSFRSADDILEMFYFQLKDNFRRTQSSSQNLETYSEEARQLIKSGEKDHKEPLEEVIETAEDIHEYAEGKIKRIKKKYPGLLQRLN